MYQSRVTVTAQIRSESTWSKGDTSFATPAKPNLSWEMGEEKDSGAEHRESNVSSKNIATTTTKYNNGFYEKTTIWQQELHRYKPSGWLIVRVGTLIAFPYAMTALGAHIWPQVVALADFLGVETSAIVQPAIATIGITAFSILNFFYAVLYHYDIPALDQYRVDDKPWHWEMDPEGWSAMLRETLGLVLFNGLCVTPPLMYLIKLCLGTPNRMDIASLPGGGEVFWQLLFCLVLEDFGFHHAHQLLHTKQLYWIHKIHHRYHAPIGISSVYAHPIEYVIGNVLPSMLGPMLLQQKMHSWSLCIWFIFRSSAAVENHSGYEFPWSMFQAIPFKAPTEYHDFHHNKNQGTYSGVLRFWDWVYGTNQQYFDWVRAGRPQKRNKKGSIKKQS